MPYVKTYRDPANLTPSRDTVQSNVDNIVADFNQGISMMNSTSDNAQYMNKGAAYALLARAANYYDSVILHAMLLLQVLQNGCLITG